MPKESGMIECEYAGVVVDAPMTTIYHYRVPPQFAGRVRVGMRVGVSFGPRRLSGFCVELSATCPLDPARVKDLSTLGPEDELVSPELLKLTKWIAQYYHAGWGQVLTAAVPAAVRRGQKQQTVLYVTLAADHATVNVAIATLKKRAPKQVAALEFLLARDADTSAPPVPLTAKRMAATAAVSRATLRSLADKKLISLTAQPPEKAAATWSEKKRNIILSAEQTSALQQLTDALDTQTFAPFLLHGVTGSGKTEVYLQALSRCIEQGRTALVLVPEISLTPQTVARFRARAKDVAVLHSHLAAGARAAEWRRLQRGDVRVVVGARSAVFAPLPNLGLVIVDEEHERTFKQESLPRYHARDVAIVRARDAGAVVVLGTATPSLESWHNTIAKKYTLLTLTERAGGAKPPVAEVVDMRKEWATVKKPTLFSRELERELVRCLARKDQTILLLNRRGFNTSVQCQTCGTAVQCPNCDIALTHHRGEELLRCHYCDHAEATPQVCAMCSSRALRFAGTGTERVEDVLSRILPQARLLRMDSDTMSKRDAHAKALAAFGRGEYDILLGTQMVAKGLDFPNVTLVGVLSADGAINLPDFRSAERTFQLITQVIGRSGRADKPGRAIVQAFQPEHYAVTCALREDYAGFAARELADRKPLGYPPYGRLLRVLVRGENEAKVKATISTVAEALRAALPRPGMLLGPGPCEIARMHGEYRHHLLIKGRHHQELSAVLNAARNALQSKGKIHIIIDIDPTGMM